MARGKHWSEEPFVARLRQIEVQLPRRKIIDPAYKETETSEQTLYRWRKEYEHLHSVPALRLTS
jgi:hypothetical protein